MRQKIAIFWRKCYQIVIDVSFGKIGEYNFIQDQVENAKHGTEAWIIKYMNMDVIADKLVTSLKKIREFLLSESFPTDPPLNFDISKSHENVNVD